MSPNRKQRRSGVKAIPVLPNDEGRFPTHSEMTREHEHVGREQTSKLGREKSQEHKARHMYK